MGHGLGANAFSPLFTMFLSPVPVFIKEVRGAKVSTLLGCSLYPTNRLAERALDAPAVRRIFSSSPKDPRYHMLTYMSNKFCQEQAPYSHEPRAALFLNRYTRTSTIMFATSGVANILGIRAEQLVGQSFYFCIAENYLSDAVRCLERAKANDSIAYLRFWFRNPLLEGNRSRDASMADGQSSDEDEDEGGVRIIRPAASSDAAVESSDSSHSDLNDDLTPTRFHATYDEENSRSSSGNSTSDSDRIFDPPAIQRSRSSASSMSAVDPVRLNLERIEVEAVVSCTSDGLVVILRRARPLIPQAVDATEQINYDHGVFAAPWAFEPIGEEVALGGGAPDAALPPGTDPEPTPVMSAIRDVAAFAWSLTGINGAMLDLANGKPSGEALPPGGLPIWDPSTNADPENRYNGFSGSAHRPINLAQVESLDKVDVVDRGDDRITSPMKEDTKSPRSIDESSSEDEVVWKRAPTMPEWRRPPRRAHQDAFGPEADAKEVEGEDRASQSRRRRLDH
jgi:virulence-associated protein VagC